MQSTPINDDDKRKVIEKLTSYLSEEHELELGQFDAEFLFEHIAKTMGAHFYNQGLYDAQRLISERMDALADAIYDLEQPIL